VGIDPPFHLGGTLVGIVLPYTPWEAPWWVYSSLSPCFWV